MYAFAYVRYFLYAFNAVKVKVTVNVTVTVKVKVI